jgi:trigger factor
MVDREAALSLVEQQMRLVQMGLQPDEAMEALEGEEQQKKAKEDVARQIRMRLILDRIADAEELAAGDDEVHTQIASMASAYGRPVGVVHREIVEGGRLEAVRESVRRRKVLDFLVAEADITRKAPGSE